jgi:iron complex transport system substrate-binding protein
MFKFEAPSNNEAVAARLVSECLSEMKRLKKTLFLMFAVAVLLTARMVEAENITYTDNLGRVATIQVPVSRAVIFQTYELIPALGIWDNIVGIGRYAYSNDLIKATKPDVASVIPSASAGSGLDANMEVLFRLKPDVVITWTVKPEAVKFIKDRGLKVIATYPESLSELLELIRLHGKLFGKGKRAETSIAEMEKVFALVNARVSEIPPHGKRKVLWLGGKPTSVASGIGITNDLIQLIGGINPASSILQGNADVSIEQIVAWDPDVIFIWGNAGYTAQGILNSSQWRLIKSVRQGRVYKAPIWSTWSPRIAPIALWMAARVYPESFRDIALEKMFDDFYRAVFGIPYAKVSKIEE